MIDKKLPLSTICISVVRNPALGKSDFAWISELSCTHIEAPHCWGLFVFSVRNHSTERDRNDNS